MALSVPIRQAIGAAGSLPNVLTGLTAEYIGKATVLTIYGNAEIVGMSWTLTGNQGADARLLVPPGSALPLASTPGKVKTNEDFIAQVPVDANTRLVLAVTNPGGASFVDFLLTLQ